MPKNTVSTLEEESSFGSDPVADQTNDISDATGPSDLARSVEVEIKGKPVTICYDLNEMTPRLRKRLSALEEGDGAEDAIVEYLETIVTGWDMIDRKGNPVSIDNMDSVSYRDLGKIADAVNRDLLPNA